MSEKLIQHRGKGRPREFDRENALRTALRLFWAKGFEPTSIAELCEAMGIKPASLYASFGNKASLFLEAVSYYEETYWAEPAKRFLSDPDVYHAIKIFFEEASRILLSPETPCGCMLVLAAVNISENEKKIIETIHKMRMETKQMFSERLRRAIHDGQISASTDVPALAGALNSLLEGLSLQARDGIFQSELTAMAAHAAQMLPAPLKK